MSMDTGNFNRSLQANMRRVVAEAQESIRSMAQEFYADVVIRSKDSPEPGGSPVASGRFAASWRLEINGMDTSVADKDRSYRYPPASAHKYNADNLPRRTRKNVNASAIAAKLRAFKLGDQIFISNALPYARRIETGAHSWQTPQGVLEVTARQIVKKFRYARLRVFNG